jgi:rhamnulokinase
MKEQKYIAFDLGAESGRAMMGLVNDNTIRLEEIHRFVNPQIRMLGHIHWDVLYLFQECKKALSLAAQKGHRVLQGIGIDTWGVDFGLIGQDGTLLGNPVAYRDPRTEGIMERVFQKLPKKDIYHHTGIQFLRFNTLFQLASLAQTNSRILEISRNLLFMPDLFNFLMTGEVASEYTIASTSQLLNAKKKEWERELFIRLELPYPLMAPIIQPGTVLGTLTRELLLETDLKAAEVITPACHDTACAIAAVPVQQNRWAYISSGTWSLLGVEIDDPIITEESLNNNFTNEGGVDKKIRFLRNTMGMWLLESCRRNWIRNKASVDYALLMNLAKNAKPFKCIIDPDDSSFLNPPNMCEAIAGYCKRTEQTPPIKIGEFVRSILESLALKYRFLIDKINAMRQENIEVLHIVGGGSQNELLNQFTADATGLPVIAGPVEATAIGNIIIQVIAKNQLNSLQDGRRLVARSFPLKTFEPQEQSRWNDVYYKKKDLFS